VNPPFANCLEEEERKERDDQEEPGVLEAALVARVRIVGLKERYPDGIGVRVIGLTRIGVTQLYRGRKAPTQITDTPACRESVFGVLPCRRER
jgi:hypothetical protein